jgi:hypothetical protein
MTDKWPHDDKRDDKRAEKPVVAETTEAVAPVEPVFEGRSGALAIALRARNIDVQAAEDLGDTGVKLTVGTVTGLQVYDLEGRDATFDVALAILGGKP